MAKWGTYMILAALLAMVFPFILVAFGADLIAKNPIFPLLTLFTGGSGVVLHIIYMLKNNTINGTALLLLTSIMMIIFGYALNILAIPNAKYLLLIGTLLIAIWIIIPSKNKKER
ncbi:hypothetical protein CW751_13650 [Brumimicrobium salinarum]|uniref:Uncharacterized protein n=1 Tax=Brumimicrobium salinarum TaxID=2058658 RepID=A0A2I0QZJ9_9FLAO|nr:hypothetical protein [Brumimicrobium salinarum]PKR79765.1 hypothetical protein CW751_13650 [Brumimicrobium salinarum]